MRILLVTPAPREPFSETWPALGLCYLSAYLKERGFGRIEGVDLNVDTREDLEGAIGRSDLVGIHCSTKAVSGALDIARLAKSRGSIVVMGGPHVSVLPEEIIEKEYVDYVILSEGEESFHELVKCLERGSSPRELDGFGYKAGGKVFINPKTRYIKNLDEIPFPDRDLFSFDYSDFVSFCATRGCPYRCANCQPALSLQTCRFRMRSIENIIAELKLLEKAKHVHFVDNDLTVNRKWLARLCEQIISERLDIRWDCQGRVNTLDSDLMKMMKKAGCVSIGLGIESGSQSFLDGFLHKQIKLDRARELFKEARKVGMPLHCWYIIGMPTETREDIERTIGFAFQSEVASVGFSIGTPWPGTTFHREASERGWILAKDWDEYNEKKYSRLRTDHWGPEDIESYRNLIIERFTSRGWSVNENDFIFSKPDFALSPVVLSARKLLRVALGEHFFQKLRETVGEGRIEKAVKLVNHMWAGFRRN